MACGIYKITNKINQHSYIGQSINIEKRWANEKRRAFDTSSSEYNKTLSKAFRKYGVENFTFEILEECEIKDLDDKEKFYISSYNSYFNGYNETTGGNSGSENQSQKISKEALLEIYDLLINSSISQREIAQKFSVGEDVISTINWGKSRRLDGYIYPLRNNKSQIKYCCDCGVELKYYKSNRCMKCYQKSQRVVERPTRDELKDLIRNKPFTHIGQLYGVSDNTIRQWCEQNNLPHKKSIIKQINNEEWEKI